MTFSFLLVTAFTIASDPQKTTPPTPVPEHNHEHDHHEHADTTELLSNANLTLAESSNSDQFQCALEKKIPICAKSDDSLINKNNSIPAIPVAGKQKWRREIHTPNKPTKPPPKPSKSQSDPAHCPKDTFSIKLCCDQSITVVLTQKQASQKKYKDLCAVPESTKKP
ncbi:hypothetical protein O181_019163 [Austropuccinia psidii MF-1]|uniref:Uncharacterized protein n=1 Tax=Austropuccinia psidii MF-1 TaxID=1389203 RepID=A0A9Q3C967_9BASI|nr:hypothetical protein [Austropuccinia psidii MF-1]